MKRAAVVTLVCMGAGAMALGAAFEEPCDAQGPTANRNAVAQAASANAPRSCSTSSGYHGGHGGFFSRVVRGGFGAFGRHFGG